MFFKTTKVESRKDKIEHEIGEKKVDEFRGLILAGVGIIAGIGVAFFTPSIGIAIGAISAGVFSAKFKNGVKLNIREARIENEIKHIKNIEENPDNSLKEINKKTAHLRTKLDKQKTEDENEYIKARTYSRISYYVTAIGAIGVLINPTLGLIAIPGIILNALTAKNEIDKYINFQATKNEINNLNHDLEFYKIKEGTVPKVDELEIKIQTKTATVTPIERVNESDYNRINDLFNEVFYGKKPNDEEKTYRKVR